MKNDILEMKSDIKNLETDMREVKKELADVKNKVEYLTLKVENEVCHNIQIVAEGHLDLNRKMEDAVRAAYERELCALRINHIDIELWKLKKELKVA